jgi:lysozyme family protein
MTKTNFDKCLAVVLHHEGGFVNHPKDPGGITNLGVTKAVYEAWVGYPVTERIMRGLTVSHVQTLYKVKYWDAVRAGDLPAGLDLCVFDFAVNAGPYRSAKYLQRMVGVTEDGKIGPRTLSAVTQYVRGAGLSVAISKFQDMRRNYYRQLGTFPTFGKGWLRRVAEVEASAFKMAV